MSRVRRWTTVAGYALFGAGVAVLGGGLLFGVDSIPAVLGGELIPVAFFTVAVVGTSIAVILSGVPKTEATSPNVERVGRGREFGTRFDRRLDGWLVVVPGDERREIREELRETALRTLVRTTDCSRETADEALETGDWTNDRVAASFFAPTGRDWRSRAWAAVGRVRFEHRVARTVRALRTIESENE